MSATALEGSDPDRASAIKRKILARLTDIERHYRAFEAAIGEFGEGFDRAAFVAAVESDDVRALNRVKAVEPASTSCSTKQPSCRRWGSSWRCCAVPTTKRTPGATCG